jgi:hypothetical protein
MLEQLLREQTTKHIPSRDNEILHASDLDSPYCPRQQYYKYKKGQTDNIQGSFLTYTFDIGHSIEDLIREHYLKDYIYGVWECMSRSDEFTFCGRKEKGGYWTQECQDCGWLNWKYKEFEFISSEYLLSCALDGILFIEGDFYLLEIKSINEELFKKLYKPLDHHEWRTQVYLNCINTPSFQNSELGEILGPIEKAYILYCAKSSGVFVEGSIFPFKTFQVNYKDISEEIKQRTEPFYEAKSTGVYPTRVCTSLQDKQALNCPFFSPCMVRNLL